jgi:hypothetical protein
MVRKLVLISHRDLTAPTSKAKPFNHPDWVWELKHDGYRALLIKDGVRISMQRPTPFEPLIRTGVRLGI